MELSQTNQMSKKKHWENAEKKASILRKKETEFGG